MKKRSMSTIIVLAVKRKDGMQILNGQFTCVTDIGVSSIISLELMCCMRLSLKS